SGSAGPTSRATSRYDSSSRRSPLSRRWASPSMTSDSPPTRPTCARSPSTTSRTCHRTPTPRSNTPCSVPPGTNPCSRRSGAWRTRTSRAGAGARAERLLDRRTCGGADGAGRPGSGHGGGELRGGELGELHRVQRRTLAQVVVRDEQGDALAVGHRLVLADAAHEAGILSRRLERVRDVGELHPGS